MADAAHDTLRALEERLARASGAAERLFSEAAAQATSAALRREAAPPQGWATSDEPQASDFEVLIKAIDAVGDLIPPELRRRLQEAVRELLLAVRALIDWYLERTETRSEEPPEVQDIPIV